MIATTSSIVGWLREGGTPWPGPAQATGTAAESRLGREAIPSRLTFQTGSRFLPYLDRLTEETAAVRAAYRVMVNEPMVKAGIWSKVLAVAALDSQIQPTDETSRAATVAEFSRHLIRSIPGSTRAIVTTLLPQGLIDGNSVAERPFVREKRGKWAGKYIVPSLKTKDVDLETDEFYNVTKVLPKGGNSKNLDERDMDPSRFVIWSNLPVFANPAGTSDLRAAYQSYWLIDTVLKLRMIGLDRFTLPTLMGEYADLEQKPELEKALANARAMGWFLIPAGAKVEAVKLAQGSEADFRSALQDLERRILVAIAFAYLQFLEGKTTGARNMGMVHQDTTELLPWYLAAEISDVITQQILKPAIELNFADAEVPALTLGAVNEAYLQAVAQVDTALVHMGLALSKKERYQVYGRTPPDPNDPSDHLVLPQAQAPMGFAAPPSAAAFTEPAPPADPFPLASEWQTYVDSTDD